MPPSKPPGSHSQPVARRTRIRGARAILINITGSSRLGLHEVNEACDIIREAAECDDVQINFGIVSMKHSKTKCGYPSSRLASRVQAAAATVA